jgi:hypothetical protein
MIPLNGIASLGAPKLLSRNDLVLIILRLEFEGWKLAAARDSKLTNSVSETYMNGRLFQGMRDVRNTLGLTNLFLIEAPGVRSREELARPDREPDLILLFAEFGANEPHAIIECKRVDPQETSRTLRRAYVREGMDRFIDGAYGQGHELDFMVGYLLRGDGSAALSDINAYLQNVGRPSCGLRPNTAFSRLGYVAVSNHSRPSDGSAIRLLHSFLEFSPSASQP